jgi:hypothetical protein
MAWSGGTFTRIDGATGWQDDEAAGTGIEAGLMDTAFNDLATDGINQSLNKAGQNTPTANLPMGGYKHTGVADASSNNEYTTQGQLQDNSFTAELEALEVAPSSTALALTVISTAGVSGEFAKFTKNGGDKIISMDKIGFVGVNTDSPLVSTAVPFQVYPQNGIDGNSLCYAVSDGIADNESSGWFVRASRSGGSSRQAAVGVRTHAGITDSAGFLYVQEEDGGNAYVWADNSQQMRVSSNPAHVGTTSGVVIGTQTSDERLKDIEPDFGYGLEQVKALKPIAYVRKDDPEQVRRIGFGAQTTKPIVPEAVYDTNEELEGENPAETKLAMDYTSIIPVLVKAIQELEAKVASLEAQVAGA